MSFLENLEHRILQYAQPELDPIKETCKLCGRVLVVAYMKEAEAVTSWGETYTYNQIVHPKTMFHGRCTKSTDGRHLISGL